MCISLSPVIYVKGSEVNLGSFALFFLHSSFGITGVKIRPTFKQAYMKKKDNSVSVLALDKHKQISTITSYSDLRLRVKYQRKVKSKTASNGKSNNVNMLALDRLSNVSTVTS